MPTMDWSDSPLDLRSFYYKSNASKREHWTEKGLYLEKKEYIPIFYG